MSSTTVPMTFVASRIRSISQGMFAATMAGLGVLGLIQRDTSDIVQPLPGKGSLEALPAVAAGILLAAGLALLWRRTAGTGARLLLGYLALWLCISKLSVVIRAPTVEGAYQTTGETLVLLAAAWVLYAGFAGDWERRRLSPINGVGGVRIARVLHGLALIAFGLSHFFYLNLTAPLVPRWLLFPVTWSYFTGIAYLAGGLGLLTGWQGRLAAMLAALQMGLLTILVWPPIAVAGATASQWGEIVGSVALTVGAWVVAESYGQRHSPQTGAAAPAAARADSG